MAARASIKSSDDWARALLGRLGIAATPAAIYSLQRWAAIEGGHWNNTAHFNPLNTTLTLPGASSMNNVGVKAYGSWEQGLEATVKTLREPQYSGILRALGGGSFDQFRSAVLASPWGTTHIPGGPMPRASSRSVIPSPPSVSRSGDGGLFGPERSSEALRALLWVALLAAGFALAGMGLARMVGVRNPLAMVPGPVGAVAGATS